jgi:hypothetical protein
MGFFLRWLVAFALLAGTYNPTPWNYASWARTNWEPQTPLAVFLGLLLLVGYIIYLRATLRSIGAFGMGLVLAIVGSLMWVLYDYGVLDLANRDLNLWLALLALSLVLGIGLSWSILRRQLSGQADIDDVDE